MERMKLKFWWAAKSSYTWWICVETCHCPIAAKWVCSVQPFSSILLKFFFTSFCETDVFYSFYCRHDSRFYMFQFLQTWDGVQVAKFGVEHIGYIRKAMLYSWLTSRKCCLDLTLLLFFADKGCFSELLYPPFIYFLSAAWFHFLWSSELHFSLYVGCIVLYMWVVLL